MPDNLIDISGLPASVVLAALYNNQVVNGFDARSLADGHMTIAMTEKIIHDRSRASYIGQLNGRIIGIDFTKSEFDPTAYDDACHQGPPAVVIINRIREVLTTEFLDETIKDLWLLISD